MFCCQYASIQKELFEFIRRSTTDFTPQIPVHLLTALGFINMITAVPVVERQNGCAPLIHFHLAGTGERDLGIVGNALDKALPQQVTGAEVRAINYNTAAEL